MYYCCVLSGDLREVPIRVTRKQPDNPIKDATNTSFSITPAGHGQYYGFEVDGNHMFCLEDYTVVHNSELLNQMVQHIIATEDAPPAVFKFEEEPHITCKKVAGKLVGKQFTNPEKVVIKTDNGKEVDVWGNPIPQQLRSTYFTEDELVAACENLGDKIIYYNNYGSARWDDVAEKIRYAVTVKGCKDVFIDPLTRLTAGMEAAEANTELERIADEISAMSKDLDFTYYIFCHLKAPSQGKPHEKGGKVESYQFTGSRAMMRACYYMLGLERNKSDDLPEIVRNMSNLVLLEDRAFGRTGRVCLFYDKDTGEYREPTTKEVQQYEEALADMEDKK
jgi:twinkle protein